VDATAGLEDNAAEVVVVSQRGSQNPPSSLRAQEPGLDAHAGAGQKIDAARRAEERHAGPEGKRSADGVEACGLRFAIRKSIRCGKGICSRSFPFRSEAQQKIAVGSGIAIEDDPAIVSREGFHLDKLVYFRVFVEAGDAAQAGSIWQGEFRNEVLADAKILFTESADEYLVARFQCMEKLLEVFL